MRRPGGRRLSSVAPANPDYGPKKTNAFGLAFFLGRFHVVVLHLPIGIILAAIIPGNAAQGGLYCRITLARDHEDFMPAEGKTPLTDIETEIIRWWIDAGAPAETTLSNADMTGVRPLLENHLGL